MFKKTLVLLTGSSAAIVFQTLQFVLLARLLGATTYGKLASITAIVTIMIPLAGLGYGNVMLMTVSRNRDSAPRQLGNSLFVTAVLGIALIAALLPLAYFLYGSEANLALALLIGASELVIVRCCLVIGQYFQAIDEIKRLSVINLSVSLCRVAAVGSLLTTDKPNVVLWASVSTVLLFTQMITHLYAAIKSAGKLSLDFSMMRSQLPDAIYFSLGTTAKAAYTDLDKVVLARNSPSAELGIYTTSYRLVTMAFLPVRALLDVSASKFFRTGEKGIKHSSRFSLKLLAFSVPYGILAGCALFVCAPLVPYLLGPTYAESVDVLRYLAPLPTIQAVHYTLADSLTGGGHQRLRTILQFLTLSVYVMLALTLIPTYGWHGAIAVCVLSELLLAILMVAATLKFRKMG